MATVGLYQIQLALVDAQQKLISGADTGLSTDGVYTVDHKDLGTKTANITGLAGTIAKTYGNNNVQDVAVGTSEPTVALDINNLNYQVKQQIKGFVSDKKGGWTDENLKAHVALLITTQTIDRLHFVYYGFGDGIMTETAANIQTDAAAEQRADDTLTYTALSTMAFNNQPYKIYSDLDSKFDKANMYKEVFGGYVLSPSSLGK
ncbi:putative phage major tail protein [Lacticaseibacillus paracasei subsp. paracasei Lpp125]|uniref:phage tail protein n=1 Tax=Lacticaseibacillus paracasei TaxID=1597 RepID=UPI000343F0DD|nr:phage tail protein [Lacticaseibacillus paracasei]EPD01561.1 putative phage major tail protein [Lacticaseibacillus paracasei subsp. paracasei Lpp125]